MTTTDAAAESARRCETAPEEAYILAVLSEHGRRYFGCVDGLEQAARRLADEGLIQVKPAEVSRITGRRIFAASLAA